MTTLAIKNINDLNDGDGGVNSDTGNERFGKMMAVE